MKKETICNQHSHYRMFPIHPDRFTPGQRMLAVKCSERSALVCAVTPAKSLHLMFAQKSNIRFLKDQVHVPNTVTT